MLKSVINKTVLSGFVLLLLIIIACGDDDNMANPGNEMFPEKNLSYVQHIQPIFFQDCATAVGCHQSAARAGGLDLESSNPTFISDNGLAVIPFNASQSNLFLALFDEVPGVSRRMPPNSPRVSDARARAIETWINEGAITAN
jgi:hypothetical protein